MRTVVGVFPSKKEAESVALDLQAVGIPSDDVSIAGADTSRHDREWSRRNIAACGGLSFGWLIAGLVPFVAEGSRAGATGFGAAFGGIAGVIAGLVALAVRGGAPVIADSVLATVIAAVVVGAMSGGLIAGVYNMGVSHEVIPLCEEAVREHGVVVAVHVDAPRASEAFRIMNEHGARNLRADADAWLASGWTGAYPDEKPYPSDSSVRSHEPGKLA